MDKSVLFFIVTSIIIFSVLNSLEVNFFAIIAILVVWFLVLLFIELGIDKVKASKPEVYTRKFYEECVKAGIKNLSSKANIQRATLLQEKMGYKKHGDVMQLFQKGEALVKREKETIRRSEAAAKLRDARKKDINIYEKSIKYAELIGVDKRLTMMRDRLSELENRSANSHNAMMTMTSGNLTAMMEEEKSWGLAGGIAEGIAGPAAGVAAAIEVEAENQRIRERNAQRREEYIQNNADAIIAAAKADNNLSDKIKRLRKKIEKNALKLVCEDEDVFKKLEFGETSIQIISSNLLKVEVFVKSNVDFIFEDVPAVADGTIKGVLYRDNIKLSEVLLTLPETGVSKDFVIVKGYILDLDLYDVEDINVVYEPYHLWEIEK